MDDKPLDLSKKSTSSTKDYQLFSSDKYLESEEEKQIISTSRIFFQEEFSKSGEISRKQNEQQNMKAVPFRLRNNANEILVSQETITGNSARNKRKIPLMPETNSGVKRQKDVESALSTNFKDTSKVIAVPDCIIRAARDSISPKPSTSTDTSCGYDSPAVQGPSTSHNRVLPFICEHCGKGFPYHSKYKRHVRSHTGEKLFACKLCDKKFSTASNLAGHISVHTGELPFWCQECNKRFAYSCNLKVHMRIHSGEKPYECEICGRRFSQKITLDIHKDTHY